MFTRKVLQELSDKGYKAGMQIYNAILRLIKILFSFLKSYLSNIQFLVKRRLTCYSPVLYTSLYIAYFPTSLKILFATYANDTGKLYSDVNPAKKPVHVPFALKKNTCEL